MIAIREISWERHLNKKKLGKAYQKITNIRADFQHKLSTRLIKENDTVIIENLNIASMMKMGKKKQIRGESFKPSPKKSNVSDASWYSFTQMLIYKAESAGRSIVKVFPRGTSKTCSNCSHVKTAEEQTLADRWFTCEACYLSIDRDHNAALNIRNKGLGMSLATNSVSETTSE